MGTGKNSINRNILECKVREDEKRRIHKTVLIETYWNVKLDEKGYPIPERKVLIETYWNVKEEMGCKAILIATY